ncbi:sensor histidine kinase [Pseudosporangium ferrugineum]|uniref:histidine kinase n=1 Tax=Pseudosporangium ferrugineum TaxID=439699 RepID=A0A2T0RXC1_9ACTN|nr:GAF domain-containing sensor histidine kinase [Pseudosporangium ferrugineum]PRY25821.1 histidine kinase/DNA gyrase B/HSP90-like ATPase [Pseudosporangium ferrugineum]
MPVLGFAVRVRLAWGLAGVALALVAGTALAALAGTRDGLAVEGRDWLLAVVCAPLGARVATHAARNACGWLVLAVGVLGAATVATSAAGGPAAGWLREWLWWPGYGLLVLVVLLFPDGRPAGRTGRVAVAATTVATAAGTVALAALALRAPRDYLAAGAPVRPSWDTTTILVSMGVVLVAAVFAVVSLGWRAVRSRPARRGVLVAGAANAALLLTAFVLDTVEGVPLVWLGGALAIPLATAIGVVRYGLYDIDLLVHRALVSGLSTLTLIITYAATVALVAGHVPAGVGPIAAAVTVVALLPLRQGIDNALRRLLYGLGADPYALTTLLGTRVGHARTPEEVLAAAAGVIGAGLKSPYVAVHSGDREPAEAVHGRPRDWPVTSLPLIHQGRPVGRLIVQQRAPDEPWSRRERALMRHLVAQLAPAAASVNLTRDLQAARERLVRAREEELRRLQRDLHDGVGPLLSGTRMLARAARGGDTADLLTRIEGNLADAAGEVRRIVDGLRPPALDHGLAPALTHAVDRHRASGLDARLTVEGELTELPAAVEVAVYRVVDEALTNVVKHAGAGTAHVRVRRSGDDLCLSVSDDGTGGVRERPDGVGVASMRQRCEELGGSFTVTALSPGTRLSATIPLS